MEGSAQTLVQLVELVNLSPWTRRKQAFSILIMRLFVFERTAVGWKWILLGSAYLRWHPIRHHRRGRAHRWGGRWRGSSSSCWRWWALDWAVSCRWPRRRWWPSLPWSRRSCPEPSCWTRRTPPLRTSISRRKSRRRPTGTSRAAGTCPTSAASHRPSSARCWTSSSRGTGTSPPPSPCLCWTEKNRTFARLTFSFTTFPLRILFHVDRIGQVVTWKANRKRILLKLNVHSSRSFQIQIWNGNFYMD